VAPHKLGCWADQKGLEGEQQGCKSGFDFCDSAGGQFGHAGGGAEFAGNNERRSADQRHPRDLKHFGESKRFYDICNRTTATD